MHVFPLLMLCAVLSATAQEAPEPRDLDPEANMALGKTVTFAPAPNYGLTARDDTDHLDLTDGRLTAREDQAMWFESHAVGWSYAGRVNLSVDLEQVQAIEEVAIRLLGGSPQASICMPGWVEVLVSDGPGEPYHRVAEFSRWNPGDHARFEVPRYEGTAWVHRLRFRDLNTRGRMVGIRLYGAGLSCSDELYVFRGAHDPAEVTHNPDSVTDFTVSGAQLYFHKPAAHVSAEVVTPLPLGCVFGPAEQDLPMTVSLTVPHGVEIPGGALAGVSVEEARVTPAEEGTQYVWDLGPRGSASTKTFGRLYWRGAPQQGAPAELSYQVIWGDYTSPVVRHPVEVVEIPPQPVMPQRLMTTLSWGGLGMAQAWPDWHQAFSHIGFNTVSPSATWFTPDDQEVIDFTARARELGYRVQLIDSTWHRMLSLFRGRTEFFCQFEDGTHNSRMCPSYRGECYDAELERVATVARLLKPDFIHCDIELWDWRGPVDAQKCTRCNEDKAASGLETWEEWQLAKGEEMWTDLFHAVQQALEEEGLPPCEMAVYDFRPGRAYQFFWPFDRLYPDLMHTSQVSTYTPLEPYHIELVGNDAREDREKLPRSDQVPWITPGDAGTFPGEAFYFALLESFCNGSRGLNFWSNRVWDADVLAGYARAIRALAPVEDILVDGDLYLPEVDGPGRVSGMIDGTGIILLVADYHGDGDGTVRLRMNLEAPMRARDLDTGDELGTVAAGETVLTVDLDGQSGRLLHLRP